MNLQPSIDDRMRLLISATIPDRMRYIELEAATDINADTWKNFWFKRRKADGLMVERLSKVRPEYAFWLATGATDVMNGHRCPPNADCFEPRSEPLQSAEAVLRNSVNAANAVESLHASFPEHSEEIAKLLHRFASGDAVHEIPRHLNHLQVDATFKALKALNLAVRLREEERKLHE